MIIRRRTLLAAAASTPLAGVFMSESASAASTSNTIHMTLPFGVVTIELRPDLAPKTCEQIRTLTARGFYNGCEFFRVIAGFMAQTGDPTNTGTGGSNLPNVPAEFTDKAKFLTGSVGMARTSDPNSGNSQFFICFAPAAWLDGQYTLFGQVTAGMDYVDEIKKGQGQSGRVTDPTKIIKMELAA
ncbi:MULTISPECIES: peptidylprolyl isomerase [Acidiphilium]|jgi:cyclophilin family peptidyl-prolyl cis-trans isomerase|uniref:Peptidyl-prolyl cis-trans isomerase n=2 Tax=Acidiphilium TaxID=522 RepID=A5FXQ7_ACICJ|nr:MULTISPECIES: peptidylprolyl isomerase [Acidiphilium]EGO93915.1 Peptidyl-prolyl cis-trans isomerase, cyclophilin type [Acidiphilium sp. PM]MBU6356959.1 peptidylprolyl isomerase [Rhodospirillales bacterium]ABQ30389.1 peptidyl-prolyl cis-trans isomerase, cyclophilin type [Acidiphilium cryptum JF-5]MBS3025158.1 peptidylprolyl isomerase [Acidiphilium multivorum]MDE2328054.1 peptidylprolyl isomerase [Rhodospirillales bacterium]